MGRTSSSSSSASFALSADGKRLEKYTGRRSAVTIPDGVEVIGKEAFLNNKWVREVAVPDGVKTIESGAFSGCTRLDRITVPETAAEIQQDAFLGTPWLLRQGDFPVVNGILIAWQGLPGAVRVPDGVKRIPAYVFQGSDAITELYCPSSVTEIGGVAFQGCSRLQKVQLGYNLRTVPPKTFQDCCALKEVHLSEKTDRISYEAFQGCLSLTEIELPQSITIIGHNAFRGCRSLPRIDLPSMMYTLGDNAFTGCVSLTEVNDPFCMNYHGKEIFENCMGLKKAVLHEKMLFSGEFYHCSSLKTLVNLEEVTEISAFAMSGTGIEELKLPNIRLIGKYAFCDCASLGGTLVLTKSIRQLHEGAFCGAGLERVAIEGDIDCLPDSCFFACKSLQKVSFTGNVNTIEKNAFNSCEELVSVELPDSLEEIQEQAFAFCLNLEQITLPVGLRTVGAGAFCLLPELKYLHFPSTVETIGDNALLGTKLQKLRLDTSFIPTRAFGFGKPEVLELSPEQTNFIVQGELILSADRTRLEWCQRHVKGTVAVPETVKHIGARAFHRCSEVTEVVLPHGLLTIEEHAFETCGQLSKIVLPECVTSIGEAAFQGCTGLQSLVLPENVSSIGEQAFSISMIQSLVFPASVQTAGKLIADGCPLRQVIILGQTKFQGKLMDKEPPDLETIADNLEGDELPCSAGSWVRGYTGRRSRGEDVPKHVEKRILRYLKSHANALYKDADCLRMLLDKKKRLPGKCVEAAVEYYLDQGDAEMVTALLEYKLSHAHRTQN